MIVVAAILEKGDIFLRSNVKYRVTAIDDDYVYYSSDMTNKNGKKFSMDREYKIGHNSKQKMILIEDSDWGDPKNFPNIFTKPSQ